MCSKSESKATYCSEVEELLKAPSVTSKQTYTNVPLRRSQRLYQKLKAKTMLADSAQRRKVTYVEDITVFNKLTQDIFSTQDIREEEEISQLYNILSNEFQSFATEHIPEISGVPLDLSKKSKELMVETPRTNLIPANKPIELKPCNIENVLRVSKCDNQERKKLSKTRKLNLLHLDKGTLPRKPSRNKRSKAVLNRNKTSINKNSDKKSKKGSVIALDSVQDLGNSTENPRDKNITHKRTYKKSFQSVKEKSPLIFSKRIKLSNDETINNLTENENLAKISKQKLNRKNYSQQQSKSLSNDCTQLNLNISKKSSSRKSKKVTNKTSLAVKNLNHSCCLRMPLEENSQILLNEHIKSNKLKNEVKSTDGNSNNISKSKSLIFTEKNATAGAITDEFKNPVTKLKLETKSEDLTKMQPIKRSCENYSTTITQSNEFEDVQKIVKSEPFSSINVYEQTSEGRNWNKISVKSSINLTENICTPGAVSHSLQKNLTQDKNQQPKWRKPISQKSSGELKSSMMLRSATTAVVSQKLERRETETPQHITFTQQMKKLSDQHINEDVLNKNELNNLKLNTTGSRANFTKKKKDCRKTPRASNSNDIQPKAEVKSENSILNKNYIKSFDKTKFLDKIQNSRNDFEIISSQSNSKLNAYVCLLTPADSSEDLLKRSILPDVYPPHFKHQLPPEAVLTRSLECQPYPTSAITPDDTISAELLESSCSSPSLPESLCKLFQAKDIKEVLNVERKSYRLHNYHVQALALILKLRLEYLVKILDKLLNMSPHVLKNIHKAVKMPFVPDDDIFATSPDNK